MEYYSAIKKNEILAFTAIWMDPEIIILSEAKTEYFLAFNAIFHFITIRRLISTNDSEEDRENACLQYLAHLQKGSNHSKARVMDRTTGEGLLRHI